MIGELFLTNRQRGTELAMRVQCAYCREDSSLRHYYQCKTCGDVFCDNCARMPLSNSNPFAFLGGVVLGVLGDRRCKDCFDVSDGGGESILVYRPPT